MTGRPEQPKPLELADVQGVVFSGYRKHRKKSSALFLSIDTAKVADAKAWLRKRPVKSAVNDGETKRATEHIAFTASGLRVLGLSDDALATFPFELLEGMHKRPLTLGDAFESAPEHWSTGGDRLHLLALIYGSDETHAAHRRDYEQAEADGIRIIDAIETTLLPDDKEHFGFKDGISQPIIEGAPGPMPVDGGQAEADGAPIRTGEFVLGYLNEYDQMPHSPSVSAAETGGAALPPADNLPGRFDIGRNGTYLVCRVMDQHVSAFWDYCNAQSGGDSARAEQIAAEMVGRFPNGVPLADPKQTDGQLGWFNYEGDAEGRGCPLGAHIRRSNPRGQLDGDRSDSVSVSRKHRILRRGRPYELGSSEGARKGLLFLCVNANIRRQFEFIQQTWCDNPKFAGLYDEDDPIIGQRRDMTGGRPDQAEQTRTKPLPLGRFTIQDDPVRQRLVKLPPFVTVRGGGYFFLPSKSILEWLLRPS